MPQVVSVLNHKGGVGKTTSAVSIAACLGNKGRKVLLIDMDPQGSATSSFGLRDDGAALLNALQKTAPLPVTTTMAQDVDLVPSGPELAVGRQRFSGSVGAELLGRSLKQTNGPWQWILIDCPPSMEILTRNALRVSNTVFVPVEANYLGLSGLQQVIQIVDNFRSSHHHDLEIGAVIPCRAHPRRRIHDEVMASLLNLFPGKVTNYVRENVSLAEAPGHGLPVIYFAPRSHGSVDYQQVTNWILRHCR